MQEPASKEQEREAIGKIRKIIAGLGNDSYVGTAMQGVLEVAEKNIEDDAFYSLKEQIKIAENELMLEKGRNVSLAKECKEMEKCVSELEKSLAEAEQIFKDTHIPQEIIQSILKNFEETNQYCSKTIANISDSMAAAILFADYENAKMLANEYGRMHSKQDECKKILSFWKKYCSKNQEG